MRTLKLAALCSAAGAIAATVLGHAGYDFVHGMGTRGSYRDAFILLVCTLPGLLWGLLVGVWPMPRAAAGKPRWIGLSITLGGVLLAGGGMIGVEYLGVQATIPREARLDGRKLTLEFELILPPGREFPRELAGWEFECAFGTGGGGTAEHRPVQMFPGQIRADNGSQVLPGRVPLDTATWRNLLVTISNSVETGKLRDTGPPRRAELEWSPWRPDPAGPGGSVGCKFQIRYRLQFATDE